jgi:lipoate-protein ligase A
MYIDDQVLSRLGDECTYAFRVYEQERTEVVLGRACKQDDDIIIAHCTADGVPVLKRAGGGGTVVLCSGMVVVSAAGRTDTPFALKEHMTAVNERIIRALQGFGIRGLAIRGISDIAIGDRKILGASLHRRHDNILYQGSLLVSCDIRLFERYLVHPGREPDYRAKRPHAEFCTTLSDEGYDAGVPAVIRAVERELESGPPWKALEETMRA